MRKLASIQKVLALHPIPNADAIELAQINGWQCVVKKGEFSVGDLGVYFEIDAVPPDMPVFDFLWKGQPKRPESLRIKTLRLRGALSQGLLLPTTAFPELAVTEGADCTEALGVTKYEPPAPEGMEDYGGPFPGLVPKTHETRVQSFPQLLDELKGLPYVITLKCDGTSSTFCMSGDKFLACGHNHAIKEGDSPVWSVATRYSLPIVMAKYPHLALQGEVVGPGIRKNPMGLKSLELRAFNLYDMRAGRHMDFEESLAFYTRNSIPYAPVLEEGAAFNHTLESLLALAEGKYEGSKNEREGIVIRPKANKFSPTLAGRLSFKAINNRFLLKGGD
jgi:RNA ligase (TIGR02306 family)